MAGSSASQAQTEPSDLFSQEVAQVSFLLSKSKAFQQIHILIKDILSSDLTAGKRFSHPSKEHLKFILSNLGEIQAVDEVWSAYNGSRPSTTTFGPKTSSSQVLKREVKTSSRSSRGSQNPLPSKQSRKSPVSRHSPTMTSLQARSFEEMYSLVTVPQSEFTHVTGSATFARAPREKSPGLSPGPADYQNDILRVREKSPRVMMSQGGRRFDYIPDTCSPGPGRYYPVRRYLSK